LLQIRFDQLQHPPIGDLRFDFLHQTAMRNRVEVSLDVHVHHPNPSGIQMPLHFAQSIFRASFRTEAVAASPELLLEDRFDHAAQC